MASVSVLFICLGNICRSPMAEAIFRQQVSDVGLGETIGVDSAGTGDWHVGNAPHRGTLTVLRQNGINGGELRARQLGPIDLDAFDYLIVMDESNQSDVEYLARRSGGADSAVIARLLDYADPSVTQGELDVPDPYFSGGFDHVYRLVESGCAGLLNTIVDEHGL